MALAENSVHNLRMERGDYLYIWEAPEWPDWRYDLAALAAPLAAAAGAQGLLLGRMYDAGVAQRTEANLVALTADVLKTSEIEGESLNPHSVRSSIARRLGVDIGALAPVDRHVEGIVEMTLDATQHCYAALTRGRLLGWHAALFPTGYSGLSPIRVGTYRDDARGPMQVVSGSAGRQRVHFEAPPAPRLKKEMPRFLRWVNTHSDHHPIIKAGIAHLWFVTLHPFDDGNGRIARAIGDMLLARMDGTDSGRRFYSLSAQIQHERRSYYEILERTQKGTLDITEWLAWFLRNLQSALDAALHTLDAVLAKSRFWQRIAGMPLNERQSKLVNRLLDGFDGKLTSSKWAAIAKCSPDTALRDINELMALGVLQRSEGGGRSTAYELAEPMPAPDAAAPVPLPQR